MTKNKSDDSDDTSDPNARLSTSPADRTKAGKWFDRARDLGGKRQFDYAIEYYVNGLEFWPDAVEEACKPLHGCAVARRQTGGKKPGLKDTMKRSMNDKDPRKALHNSLWLFGHDPESTSFIEGVARNSSRLRAEDAAKWAAGVLQKSLETAPKTNAKQFLALMQLLEDLGDRATARDDASFGVSAFEMGIEVLSTYGRRIGHDDKLELAIKNLSTKLTILRGKYDKGESYRDSLQDSDEQAELHDEKRSIQSSDRVDELVAKAEADYKQNPSNKDTLKKLVDMLCRREKDEEESRAIEILLAEYKRDENYRWKLLADDIRMKQLGRKTRLVAKTGDAVALKEQRIDQLRFELGVFKERVERYPTDNRIRFEFGVRNFQAGRFDDAIPLFQGARADPKNRASCGMYLGRCFFRKGYHTQAISALEEAIKEHEFGDDDLAKVMFYWLGRSQEVSGDIAESRKTYGKLLQIDYNYSDVRVRLDASSQDG